MKLTQRMRPGASMPARTALAGVPATLLLGLMAASDAQAECKPGGPIESNVTVVCEGGIDFYGVSAKSGATHITVEIKDDGSIDAYNTAIQLGGGSTVGVQGKVWSANNHAISASGIGGQDITIGSFAELSAANHGIVATGQGPLGNVFINNAGTIGGLLNQGGIRATVTSTENMRLNVSNAGLIRVDGTGGGIHASGYLNSTVSVNNSGHIIAASHALRAQGQDVTLRNTGAIDIVRSSAGYGIYGEATFTTAKKAEVNIYNDAAISFSEASGYGVGIWAQASVSTPDLFDSDNRGIAKVTNHGNIIGLGRAAGGIHASGKDEAEIVNRGTISMSGAGAGLRAESSVKALIDNNAAVSAYLGIGMTAIDGTATLRNSGKVTGNTIDAINITARIIDANNSGDLRGGLISGSGIGLNLLGQYRTTLVNSGDINGATGAIQAQATGSGGRVLVTNTGKLVAGAQTVGSEGIDVLGDDGAKVDNSGSIDTTGTALQVRSANGTVEVINTGALTKVGSAGGSSNLYRIAGQVSGTSGNILIENSGRVQAGNGTAINAVMQTVAGTFTVLGDATVRNSGELFVGSWGITVQTRLGTATIDNEGRIDSDGGGFYVQAAKAVIDNRAELDMDGRSEAIKVLASRATDSFAQVVNSGAILLNEKSGYTRAVYIDTITEPGAPEWGRSQLTNRADIVSLGTNNAGVLLTGTRANVVVDNSKAIRVQGVAIETRSNDGNINVRNTGALDSTLQHGVLAFADLAGDILIDNDGAITAQVGGLYAAAAGNVAEVVNSGAISVGAATGITAGGIVARGGRAAIVNHGNITMSSAGSALMGVSSSADSDVRITNHGTIAMGNSSSAAIYASAGFSGLDERSGFVHVNNQGDITGGRGAGIDAFAELAVVLTNNRLIETGGSAILMRSRDNGLGSLFNDRNGQLINNSAYGATVRAWDEQDIIINAGVITNRSASAGAKAVDLGGGSDVMELERSSKIIGVVDGGSGPDTLRWGGVASAASPGRFEMSTVGTQYINFERFVKSGSSTWVFEGAGNGIDLLEIAEGTARVDGVLGGNVTVRSGGVLGGNGRMDGQVLVEAGGRYAPGASIGSQTVASLVLDDDAVFQLELDAGGLFDTVNVLGNAQLGGWLEIHFLDTAGFVPGWRASFLQAASVTGAFTGYRVTGLDGTASFDVVAGANGMDIVLTRLEVAAVPEPAAAWLFATGLAGLGLYRRRQAG
jgi:hypothetical protein